MEIAAIDSLPDEILIKILSLVSPKLLKKSALVCKRLNLRLAEAF